MSRSSRASSIDEGVGVGPTSDLLQTQPELPLSKNKLKKLRRDQAWEEGRERRKELRKIKKQEKRERKRAAACKEIQSSNPTNTKRKANDDSEAPSFKKPKHQKAIQLPVSFVIDCGFDDLMLDGERKSLASQVTRSYSDNHRAPFRSHLFVSSFGGHLKERFDNVLSGHHHSWKGVKFLENDFEQAAIQANELMKSYQAGEIAGAFEDSESAQMTTEASGSREVVYLTSDSPDTLTELKPYSTYIIGGLVDKNRHKGICYKRAMDRGMKTAKLPIVDYMKMSSRFVLATNHVVEIMLRWLELGDWGMAFLKVMPKRKCGILKDGTTVPEQTLKESTPDGENGDELSAPIHADRQLVDKIGGDNNATNPSIEPQEAKNTEQLPGLDEP
ncbi:MAG: hypothetical protein Q9181_001414 [Wetmoreana brouardii]